MKYVSVRPLMLALAFTFAGAACDQAEDPVADQGAPRPAADQAAPAPTASPPAAVRSVVGATQQSAATFCTDEATLLIAAGPGHPFNLCRWDHVCYTFNPITWQTTRTVTDWHLGTCPPNI
jgi:hypothetical protein